MAEGKSVLFVAEKEAAIDAVKKRIEIVSCKIIIGTATISRAL